MPRKVLPFPQIEERVISVPIGHKEGDEYWTVTLNDAHPTLRGCVALVRLGDEATDENVEHAVSVPDARLLIRNIERRSDNTTKLICPKYPPRIYPTDDVKVLGRVVRIYTDFENDIYWEYSRPKDRESADEIPLLKVHR